MSDQEIEKRLAEKELLDALNGIRTIEGFPPLSELPEPPFCSFCGRAKNEVGALVEGHNAYICAQCAAEARRLLLRETGR
ncbi:ClpX C4-type zinc finger protein [Steroidobacter cummioxidans]|uniref:ClpX C4-type zinc finger protein n=1 Tax=Steroidobacter cummioxidans TaxID=1803913 RepID=UPI000E320226